MQARLYLTQCCARHRYQRTSIRIIRPNQSDKANSYAALQEPHVLAIPIVARQKPVTVGVLAVNSASKLKLVTVFTVPHAVAENRRRYDAYRY